MDYSGLHEKKQRGTPAFPVELYRLNSRTPRYEMPFHWHMDHELIHVYAGRFSLSLDGAWTELQPGDTAWVAEGVLHGGEPHDCDYSCLVFDLDGLMTAGPIASSLFQRADSVSGVFRKGSRIATLSEVLLEEMERGVAGYEWTVTGLLWQMMGEFLREREPVAVERRPPVRLKPVLSYIHRHYGEPLTLTQLAETAGMAPRYFCRAFAALTGHTPIEYLNRYRIERAAEQLRLTGQSITAIALSCGFNDMSYFARMFRRYKGESPTAYRAH